MRRHGLFRCATLLLLVFLIGTSCAQDSKQKVENGNNDKENGKDNTPEYQKVDYSIDASTGLSKGEFVRRNGMKFNIGGCDFVFAGFNIWQALELSADLPTNRGKTKAGRAHLSNIFNEAAKNGLKVIRMWAHTIRQGQGEVLQTKSGEYNEEIFQGMDWIVSQAGKHGLKLIWIFADNWYDIGGVKQYAKWSGSDFFAGAAKSLYKKNIKAILNRKNSITGKTYKDDPTIMAWNLANELRCQGCPSSRMQQWVEEMCGFVKGIDGNHLVGIGQEGFYGPDSGLTDSNPAPWAADEGQNFIKNHQAWCVDYVGLHVWPDNWNFVTTEFQKDFIDTAVKNAEEKLGKPVILEEFGKIGGDRDSYYKSAFEKVESSAKSGGAVRGVLFYHWYDQGIGPGKYGVWQSSSTFNLIRTNARVMESISTCS